MESNKQKSYKTLADLSIAFDNKELTTYELLNYAFDIGHEYGKDFSNGTITWLTCDVFPPKDEITELGSYSKSVLITDGVQVSISKAVRAINDEFVGWFGANLLTFTPTHWAYINNPK